MKIPSIFLTGFLLVLLVACGNSAKTTTQAENLITVTPTFTKKPVATSTALASRTTTSTSISFTPTETLNPTQQIWISTAIVVRETQQANDKAN